MVTGLADRIAPHESRLISPCIVHIQDQTISESHNGNGIRDGLENSGKFLFALTDQFVGFLAFGDVYHHSDQLANNSLLRYNPNDIAKPHNSAVSSNHPVFENEI